MRQEHMQEIARRDAKRTEDMIKMKEQLQNALDYLHRNQDPSASATQGTVSMATSSSSDATSCGFDVITCRHTEQRQQLPRMEDSADFVDVAESVFSREFLNVTGVEE